MFLVQMLLPLYDDSGQQVSHDRFVEVRSELTDRFGGVTAFLRSPAQGMWKEKENSGEVDRDELIMCEVMVEHLERSWWESYRRTIEKRFGQRELMLRAIQVERL